MIVRDENGIIVQHNLDYPDQKDGGDSASRTGIMAMCGSVEDMELLGEFVPFYEGKLVRHPRQSGWNDHRKTSRDQLICWAAGVNQMGNFIPAYLLGSLHNYAESWFINKDVLPPHVRYALYKITGFKAPWWIRMVAEPMMDAAIWYSCKIRPDEEQNQIICLASIYGDEWVNKVWKTHPYLGENLRKYWCGKPWRDQAEIYLKMVEFVVERAR